MTWSPEPLCSRLFPNPGIHIVNNLELPVVLGVLVACPCPVALRSVIALLLAC